MNKIMNEVDALCTKYYKLGQMDVFKDLNKIYDSLRNIDILNIEEVKKTQPGNKSLKVYSKQLVGRAIRMSKNK